MIALKLVRRGARAPLNHNGIFGYAALMPRSGSLTLSDYPTSTVNLACSRCERKGRYPKAALIARYGGDTPLPDLRHLIARCPRHGALGDACGVYLVELAGR